ncbi:class I SAM-dependent methyltransferase [Rhizorhabdus argentea]|uniref:class I SAM-dependent methyltransferase n=1 Tax=Rhizorhabdus argentea TaxID=1387174 RepID=UPI0030EC5AA7
MVLILPRRPFAEAAVADHYDELDPIYRALWGEHVHHGLWRSGRETTTAAVEAMSDAVADRLACRPGGHVVDIGCGYGATARRLAGQGLHVTGFTLSAEQAAHAPPTRNVTLHCRDWLNNGLASGCFDAAYAIESTEHMADKATFFSEAHRVLRPGGRLVVCAWLSAEAPKRWHVRHLLEPICLEGRLPSMGSRSHYLDLAAQAGFTCDEDQDLSAQVARTWTICLQRLLRAMMTDPATRTRVLRARNRLFALSLPRLILAYRTGAMRYGMFTFVAA